MLISKLNMFLQNKNKKRGFKIAKNKWLSNYIQASYFEDIDIVIELIGGAEGAAKLVFSALKIKNML